MLVSGWLQLVDLMRINCAHRAQASHSPAANGRELLITDGPHLCKLLVAAGTHLRELLTDVGTHSCLFPHAAHAALHCPPPTLTCSQLFYCLAGHGG